jgi:CRP/FNR family transcriptional regulator
MAVPFSYAENQSLFFEGEEAGGVFVVIEGQVRLSVHSKDGKRLSLRIARKGEILGLASALSGNPYEISAATMYPSRIAVIGRNDFLGFLQRHPGAYHLVTEELSHNVTMACDQLRSLGFSSTAPEKLARLLLDWSDDHGVENGSRVRFSLTHEEIGEFIGASRETVTRTLSTFRNQRLVAFKGSMLTIPNRTALASFAGRERSGT